MNIDLSERAALQQGVIVANSSFTNHYQVTGGFDFDPSQFFINGSNWNKTKDATGSLPTGLCQNYKQNEIEAIQCVKNLSRSRLLASSRNRPRFDTAIFAAVLPTISFKRVSQFDFVKNNGILIPAPFLQNAQTQLTFKWDLKRAIPSSTSRVDAAAVLPKPFKETRLCIVANQIGESSITVSDKFAPTACRKFARDSGAASFSR